MRNCLTFNTFAVVAIGIGWLTSIIAAIVHNAGNVLVVFASVRLAIFPERIKE